MEQGEKCQVQVPEWYHNKTDRDLLKMWESLDILEAEEKRESWQALQTGILGESRQNMRTWIPEEFRRRNPKAVQLWEDHVFPECGNLQDYVLISRKCLDCEHFYPGGKEYHKKCGGMHGPMMGEV